MQEPFHVGWSLNHCTWLHHFRCEVGICLISKINADKCYGSGNGMMEDPSAHSQNMNDLKYFVHVWSGRMTKPFHMWAWSLNHWTMTLFVTQVWIGVYFKSDGGYGRWPGDPVGNQGDRWYLHSEVEWIFGHRVECLQCTPRWDCPLLVTQ